MEAKLAEYRARKAKERKNTESFWQKGARLFWRNTAVGSNCEAADTTEKKAGCNHPDCRHPRQEDKSGNIFDDDVFDDETNPQTSEKFTRLLIILKVVLWLLLWAIAIQVQFGAVYFAMSALAFIYVNTRTGKSRRQNMSAYSVFNPGCERLSGTLTAEQMEQSLFYRRPQVQS